MENGTEFFFQIVDVIFIIAIVIAGIFQDIMPSIDIRSGIVLLALSLITVFLAVKIVEKEIILKSMLLLLLFSSFFAFVTNLEIVDEVTFYLTSLISGILFLLASSAFISWDDDSECYV